MIRVTVLLNVKMFIALIFDFILIVLYNTDPLSKGMRFSDEAGVIRKKNKQQIVIKLSTKDCAPKGIQ